MMNRSVECYNDNNNVTLFCMVQNVGLLRAKSVSRIVAADVEFTRKGLGYNCTWSAQLSRSALKPHRKETLGRPRCRRENSIKMDLKEIDINARNWFYSN